MRKPTADWLVSAIRLAPLRDDVVIAAMLHSEASNLGELFLERLAASGVTCPQSALRDGPMRRKGGRLINGRMFYWDRLAAKVRSVQAVHRFEGAFYSVVNFEPLPWISIIDPRSSRSTCFSIFTQLAIRRSIFFVVGAF